MAKATRSAEREDGLSRERIVDAAIELLDELGEEGLTFRALAARLATGSGAIYWHIANKGELLLVASDTVVARTIDQAQASRAPEEAIRAVAAGVFETIDAHPWVGAQLSRTPWQDAMLQIFEQIGRQLQALGVPPKAQFTAASALLSYVIGVSVQNAAQGRLLDPSVDRTTFLKGEAERWKALDTREYSFTRGVADQLPKHDDRDEFLAGIDLILAGIAAARPRRR